MQNQLARASRALARRDASRSGSPSSEWPSADVLDVTASCLRHEVVVRDRIRGEMREIAEAEGAQRLVARAVEISIPTFHEWQCRPAGAYFLAMLVSAAIDPYRKSYGNARSSSAIAGGSSGERAHHRLRRGRRASPASTRAATAGSDGRAPATASRQQRAIAAAPAPSSHLRSQAASAAGGSRAADP